MENKLNVVKSKQLELIFGIIGTLIKEDSSLKEDYDFIETPNIGYFNRIYNLLKNEDLSNFKILFNKINDESGFSNIGLSLDDNYDLIPNIKMNYFIDESHIKNIVHNLKSLAMKVNWDKFFIQNHLKFRNECKDDYIKIFEPKISNSLLEDLDSFYGKDNHKYVYIPSVLMNGGFGPSNQNTLYYLRGFMIDEDIKNTTKFYINETYEIECLFHEFSHPRVNPLIDKYFNKLNIKYLYSDALEHGLPKTYQNEKTLLYEYVVRTNALVLLKKYYPNEKVSDWILGLGFTYLNDLVLLTEERRKNYNTYEEFFLSEIVPYFNNKNMELSTKNVKL